MRPESQLSGVPRETTAVGAQDPREQELQQVDGDGIATGRKAAAGLVLARANTEDYQACKQLFHELSPLWTSSTALGVTSEEAYDRRETGASSLVCMPEDIPHKP